MIIIPAIDPRDGRCVRLERGDAAKETIYDTGPWRQLPAAGGKRGKKVTPGGPGRGESRTPVQKDLVIRIARERPRTGKRLAEGSARRRPSKLLPGERGEMGHPGVGGCEEPELLFRAAQEYPGRVILGLDARDGKVAVEGWLETTSTDPLTLVETAASWGVREVIL